MVLTGSFVISSVIGLVCHRRLRFVSASLTPASRRQDHTTSPSALVPFVSDTSTSIASRPASVTIAIRPLVGRDGRDYCGDLRGKETGIFFEKGLGRQITDLPPNNQQRL
jgi:hypothetical protein